MTGSRLSRFRVGSPFHPFFTAISEKTVKAILLCLVFLAGGCTPAHELTAPALPATTGQAGADDAKPGNVTLSIIGGTLIDGTDAEPIHDAISTASVARHNALSTPRQRSSMRLASGWCQA
jgi:hypothetical protein